MSTRGPESVALLPVRARPRRMFLVVGAAGVSVVAFMAVIVGGSGGSDRVSTRKTSVTTGAARAGGGREADAVVRDASASATDAAAGGPARTSNAPGRPVAAPINGISEVPLDVSVSNTKGLRDGDAVTIRVVPRKGSAVFGFDAWLCRGNVTYRDDADIRPTLTGNCVTRPLSPASQDYVAVKAERPDEEAQTTFRVGVGSDTYRTRDGRTVTVTCGPASPCAILLELQFPNGYGLQTIPVSFA